MVTHSASLGRTEITAKASARPEVAMNQVAEAPGGLHPLRAASWSMDEYRVLRGWPVEVPPYDIRARVVVSAEGDVIANRMDPTDLRTAALFRWVAAAELYDETALRWLPLQGDDAVWETSTEYAPELITDYEYRIGSERFYTSALNFDSDTRDHMWIDFTRTLGGASAYTVIMVMSPNSAYGNNIDVPFNGLWCPGRPTAAGDTFVESLDPNWTSVSIQGSYLYHQTETAPRERAISIARQLSSSAPSYLALVLTRPEAQLYAATGPGSIQVKSIPAGTGPVALDGGVVLGRSTGDVLHTADMALLDLGVYADALTAAQIRDEIALLASVYGGEG